MTNEEQPTPSLSLAEEYECVRTLHEIQAHGYRRVALQFPDQMLKDAPHVCQLLMTMSAAASAAAAAHPPEGQAKDIAQTSILFFVIGDTSYGSCCVDEVAAQHLDADLVVHYGPACLSPTSRLPVLYVFGRKPLDVSQCATCISRSLVMRRHAQAKAERGKEARKTKLEAFLFFDLAYESAIPAVAALLQEQLYQQEGQEQEGIQLHVARVPLSAIKPLQPSALLPEPEQQQQQQGEEREGQKPRVIIAGGLEVDVGAEGNDDQKESVVIYIGQSEGNKQLANIMLRFNACKCLVYDPSAYTHTHTQTNDLLREETLTTNKELKRRYYLVQRARDAQVYGIVIGTLGVGRYMHIVTSLRTLIHNAGKKSYTLLVGKLNPAKLANFAEIEAFILVACPEASLLEEGGREFHAPVVTPLEMEMALGGKAWDGFYTTDFRELGSLLAVVGEEEEDGKRGGEEEDDKPYFSLVSGGFVGGGGGRKGVGWGGEGEREGGASTALTQYHSAAGEFLQLREYRGLGHDRPLVVLGDGAGEEGEEGEEVELPPSGIVEGLRGIASDYGNV